MLRPSNEIFSTCFLPGEPPTRGVGETRRVEGVPDCVGVPSTPDCGRGESAGGVCIEEPGERKRVRGCEGTPDFGVVGGSGEEGIFGNGPEVCCWSSPDGFVP